jgi:hypothetical protein
MTEIELNNKVEEVKSFFNLNVRMHELIAFHKVYCNKFDNYTNKIKEITF